MADWSESKIARYLARVVFQRKCLVCVPNCSWTGNECDLLAVTMDMRVIDVEVKISRADFKADAAKDKWWRYLPWEPGMADELRRDWQRRRERRLWPGKVWKHYYCLPREIWKPELLDNIGSPASGVLLIQHRRGPGRENDIYITVEKRAHPCRDASRLDAADVLDISRLAGLRMWDAYDNCDRLARENAALLA